MASVQIYQNLIRTYQSLFAGQAYNHMSSAYVNSRRIKIRLFRFLDLTWVEILTGGLVIDQTNQLAIIFYDNGSNDHLIPNCVPTPVEGSKTHQKQIQISFSSISKVEQDESDKKIVYFWIGVEPFSLSCLTQINAWEVSQMFQLLSQNYEIAEDQQGGDEIDINFIKHTLNNNPVMVSMMFNNSKVEILDILFSHYTEVMANEGEKEFFFLLFKTSIRFGGKQIIERLIKEENYKILLKILSWNPFNSNKFDYYEQYCKMVNFNNSLKIKNPVLLGSYEDNAKIKFLRDVAACMFIEVDTERVFNNFININNQTILLLISTSEQILNQIAQIADEESRTFLSIFIEIWQIFKATTTDYENRHIKEQFIKKIMEKNIHNLAVKAAAHILQNPLQWDQVDMRFHQRWIEAFNSFLSFNWEYSQEWICSGKENKSLLGVVYQIFVKCGDDGLIETILQFIRWLIQPSDNRMKMQSKFKCYVYNEFISKIWDTVNRSVLLTELYVDFIIKIYKTDYIRTRRILIENKVMQHLQSQIKKKPILICIIKLLDAFLQAENLDVFVYLLNHSLFKQLNEEYLRNKYSPNIINSCFKSVFKKFERIQSKQAQKYYHQIFLKGDTNSVGNP